MVFRLINFCWCYFTILFELIIDNWLINDNWFLLHLTILNIFLIKIVYVLIFSSNLCFLYLFCFSLPAYKLLHNNFLDMSIWYTKINSIFIILVTEKYKLKISNYFNIDGNGKVFHKINKTPLLTTSAQYP